MQSLFQRILISMDLSAMDEKLLSFSSKLNKIAPAQHIYLTHIIPDFNNPQNEDLKFHKLFTTSYPVDEKVRDILQERATDFFDTRKIPLDINVLEGQPYQKLLHWMEVKEIDLVVFGHKNKSQGSGITAKRMARKSTASALFVAENVPDKIEQILVPLDFSVHSANALKKAIALRNRVGANAKVTALYVLKFIATDYYYGLDLNPKYQEELKKNGLERFNKFLEKENIPNSDIEVLMVSENQKNIATQVNDYVLKEKPDLVIMGAKGHSPFENFLFGSVTEQFVNLCTSASVLVMR